MGLSLIFIVGLNLSLQVLESETSSPSEFDSESDEMSDSSNPDPRASGLDSITGIQTAPCDVDSLDFGINNLIEDVELFDRFNVSQNIALPFILEPSAQINEVYAVHRTLDFSVILTDWASSSDPTATVVFVNNFFSEFYRGRTCGESAVVFETQEGQFCTRIVSQSQCISDGDDGVYVGNGINSAPTRQNFQGDGQSIGCGKLNGSSEKASALYILILMSSILYFFRFSKRGTKQISR